MASKLPQGWQIKVIVMVVRQEHSVDRRQGTKGQARPRVAAKPANQGPAPYGITYDGLAVNLEHEAGMTKPCDGVLAGP